MSDTIGPLPPESEPIDRLAWRIRATAADMATALEQCALAERGEKTELSAEDYSAHYDRFAERLAEDVAALVTMAKRATP